MKKTTLKDVLKVIGKWQKDNDTLFIGSFVSFKKNGDVGEDSLIGYGNNLGVKASLAELTKLIKSDKKDFINW